jgi:hypothetical protein
MAKRFNIVEPNGSPPPPPKMNLYGNLGTTDYMTTLGTMKQHRLTHHPLDAHYYAIVDEFQLN